jgi:hypothetical protein
MVVTNGLQMVLRVVSQSRQSYRGTEENHGGPKCKKSMFRLKFETNTSIIQVRRITASLATSERQKAHYEFINGIETFILKETNIISSEQTCRREVKNFKTLQ